MRADARRMHQLRTRMSGKSLAATRREDSSWRQAHSHAMYDGTGALAGGHDKLDSHLLPNTAQHSSSSGPPPLTTFPKPFASR
mmetsp:Transcript_2598/g.7527  ORF Transcript_2598/g.7527 Transcript_2598/m.7527 type:complete len:83 (+) Transcript_2598:410-658(+)